MTTVGLVMETRTFCLAAAGLIPAGLFLQAAKYARSGPSLLQVCSIAVKAKCTVTYLIDPRREGNMHREWTYSDEPQLIRFRRRLSEAMEMDDIEDYSELAQKAGLTRACVLSYLRGTRLPSATSLVRLSRTLGVSCDWLLGFDKKKDAPWI